MRSLRQEEQALAARIFGDALDPAPVRIHRDHLLSAYAPKALGNAVHLKSSWGHFDGDGLTLSPKGTACLVHELVHVWQYQNAGVGYIAGSLWAQQLAVLVEGSRGGAYRWRRAHAGGRPWARWNPEQQAQLVEDWFGADRRIAAGRPREGDAALVALAAPFLALLRAGEGAPQLGGQLGALIGR